MKMILLLAAALGLAVLPAQASGFTADMTLRARLGYSLGGTAPVGLPASIRGLNSYRLQPNLSFGLDAVKPLAPHWGALLGLRFENKSMDEDARVKDYHEDIVRGGESLTGRFTGDVTTQVHQWMVSVPLQAVWSPASTVALRFGPYVSVLVDRSFTGYAHNGYLRVGDPTGAKVTLGDDPATRGSYDFSDDMRHLQWGLDIGADWNPHGRLGLYADLSWGLSGVHRSSFKTIEQTLYPIFGTFGLTYRLR